MNAIKYSKSTKGFYSPNNLAIIPDDAIDIPIELRDQLLAGESVGMRIVNDENGFPILLPRAALSEAEIKYQINTEIQSQIEALEKGQARAVREAALGIDGAVDRLKALDLKIRALADGFKK